MSLTEAVMALLKQARQSMSLDDYLDQLTSIASLCTAEHMENTGFFDQHDKAGECLCDCCQVGEPIPF